MNFPVHLPILAAVGITSVLGVYMMNNKQSSYNDAEDVDGAEYDEPQKHKRKQPQPQPQDDGNDDGNNINNMLSNFFCLS